MGRPNRIVVLLILVCVVFALAVNMVPTTFGGGEQRSSCKKIVLIAGKNAPGHGGPGQHFYEGGIELLLMLQESRRRLFLKGFCRKTQISSTALIRL